MWRILFLVLLVLLLEPALSQEYRSEELAEAAAAYRQSLLESVPAAQRQPALIARLRRDADEESHAKRHRQAIDYLTRAIAFGADDGLIWLRLAQNMAAVGDQRMPASAYNAYLKSTDPVERGVALFLIGRDYDRHDKHKQALAAFERGLALTQSAAVAERVDQLKRLVAFRVTRVRVEAESDSPSACLRFNEKIAITGGVSHAAFVRSEPGYDGVATVRGDMLCVNGLKHGETYELRLLPGFPAATGERTAETFTTRVVVPDRQPSISFAGTGYVLPQRDTAGLPVTTINLDRVRVRLLRVNERNLVPSIDAEKLAMKFDSYDVEQVIARTGTLVWEGEMAISGRRNAPITTAIPLKDMLRDGGPGIYLAVVERPDRRPDDFERPATNWVLVSDLGLTAYSGADGMAVAVRSLADAKPISGVAVRLYARNNGELTSATSDADGLARIPGGFLRGSGGDEPFAVMAYSRDGDFNFLEVGRPAFDLSDRGVTGRRQPGPVDAFLYTDRGIYRPGETVHLIGLVRDDRAEVIASLPVTARLLRPDGVEIDKRQITGNRLGAYELTYPLARDARIGGWRVEFRLDPKAPPIGTAEFRVEDFVPPQLKVSLSAGDEPIVPGEAFPIEVAANYYYGAPGAELAVEAEATIAIDETPFPTEPGFRFGLAEEEFAGIRRDVEAPATDGEGRATAMLALNDLPDLTRPLAATVRVGVAEPSGRAVGETITRPIRTRPLAIGLRAPQGDEAVPEGQESSVEIIAVDPAGRRIAARGLRWELLRESWQYDWYSVNGIWRHRRQVRDTPIETGTLDIAADAPGSLSRNLPAGRYRWEVTDADSGAQSSLRFHVGWWVTAEMPDVPDRLEAVADKTLYRPGETATLFVKAPFAGEAEIAIASDRILAMRSISLPEGGATVEIPVDSGWGGGVYALVSAYRPSAFNAPQRRGPGRAVGVAWFGVDPAPRTLGVTLTAPSVARPRGPVDIAIKVEGIASGEEAFVTVAAVDEAVLKLTEFDSPAPEKYYYGKRRLGVELRDIYGRLIDPRAGGVGILRSGGDQFARRSVAGLPDRSSRVVALFSGPVRVGGDGTATVRFDVPDFQGELRVMAVAYGARKLGSITAAIVVRDPVVTLVSLPRFLAPGDNARIGVVVNNLEGAPGDYRLILAATGAGTFAAPIEQSVPLAAGQSFFDGFALSATTTGNIALKLELTSPGGLRIARDFTIGVRPAQSYQLRRFVGRLEPGQSVTLDDNAADAFLPGTGEAFLTVSPRPDWDVPGLLRALDRYAYGCLEQTTSRALPLLYVDAVAGLWRTDPGFSPAETVDRAIGRAVELQRADGSFGVWTDTDETVPWLNAYAADFLIRAREHGKNVPDFAIRGALGWLRDYVRQDHTRAEALPAIAYAHYVLARGGAGDVPTLRYFNDTQLAKLPTQLAKAQLGAALAQAGDVTRANAAYDAALGPPPRRPPGLRFADFGSELRDSAATLAFAAGNPRRTPRLTEVMDRVAELFARADRTSTQEQAWLLMAAEAAARESGGAMTIATRNEPPQTSDRPVYLRRELGGGAAPVTIANRGTTPAWRTVSISGVPRAELPEESSGYTVSRAVFRRDGTPADLSQIRQGELFVVVITGSRADPARAARTLVIDLLPAGFEIESAIPRGGRTQPGYEWLRSTTEAAYIEARDDRFVGALDLSQGIKDFTLAYVVRAVTSGEFVYPALAVEDMYDPETMGRTAISRLSVSPQ
jgi:alpha-2-macroglobulin